MPHHRDRADTAEAAASRADEFADRAARRGRERRALVTDGAAANPWRHTIDAHESSARRMRSAAAALRASAQLEREHEDAHGDHASAEGEVPEADRERPARA